MKSVTLMYIGKYDPGMVQQLGRELRPGDLVEVPEEKLKELSAETFVVVERSAVANFGRKQGQALPKPRSNSKPQSGAAAAQSKS